jgi:hypothetical protein
VVHILDCCVVLRVCTIESTLQLIGGCHFHCSSLCVLALVFNFFFKMCISTTPTWIYRNYKVNCYLRKKIEVITTAICGWKWIWLQKINTEKMLRFCLGKFHLHIKSHQLLLIKD